MLCSVGGHSSDSDGESVIDLKHLEPTSPVSPLHRFFGEGDEEGERDGYDDDNNSLHSAQSSVGDDSSVGSLEHSSVATPSGTLSTELRIGTGQSLENLRSSGAYNNNNNSNNKKKSRRRRHKKPKEAEDGE